MGLYYICYKRCIVLLCLVTAPLYARESSSGAAKILFGIAANIQAAQEMGIEAARSAAAVEIARDNNATQMALAVIASNTALHQTAMAMQTTLYTTMTAAEMSRINNEFFSKRRDMELALARDVFYTNYRFEKLEMERDFNLAVTRIRLAEKQADSQIKLARMQLSYQMMASGLSQSTTAINSAASKTATSAAQVASTVDKSPQERLVSSLSTSSPVTSTPKTQWAPQAIRLSGIARNSGIVSAAQTGSKPSAISRQLTRTSKTSSQNNRRQENDKLIPHAPGVHAALSYSEDSTIGIRDRTHRR